MAGGSRDIAGLKCRDLTSGESGSCGNVTGFKSHFPQIWHFSVQLHLQNE